MRILFCYAVVLTIAGVTAYLIGSVVWFVLANVHALETAPTDNGEAEDDTADWDRAHDQWIDREAGVW